MNPLNLPGPAFLNLYFLLLAIAIIAGIVLRELIRRSVSGGWHASQNADEYELAMLSSGRGRVVQTALVALIEQGVAKARGGGVFRCSGGLPVGERSFKATVHRALAGHDKTVGQLSRNCAEDLDEMEQRLVAGGLMLPASMRKFAGLMSIVPMGCVAMMGIAKIIVGIARNRPVDILLVSWMATVAIIVLFLVKRPRRTVAGDRQIDTRSHATFPRTNMALPMLVALFGPRMLRGTALDDLRNQFAVLTRGGGWADGGGCSSGGSCGGGGCGGGGGGGGGCGGCGGGH